MKLLILSTLLILANSLSFAQKSKGELNWFTDVEAAQKEAQKTKKPMMLFFTGSDWCGWCVRLQKEVFFKDEFKDWASENVILVELDFPKSKVQSNEIKRQNQQLQQQFSVRGYPTIHFVSPEKSQDGVTLRNLGNTGYMAGGPEPWIANAISIIQPR
ncbi:MAG: thioredoxin family protein [Bacteroidetes bacterium]|nr:thioredoxin family protein [Bacteroidota bacterium]